MATTCQTAVAMTLAVIACVLLPSMHASTSATAMAIQCPDLDSTDPVKRLRTSFTDGLVSIVPCGVHMGEVEGLAVYPKEVWVILFAPSSANLNHQALEKAEFNHSCISISQRVYSVGEALPDEAFEGLESDNLFRQSSLPNPSGDNVPWVRRVVKFTVHFFGQRGPPSGEPTTPIAVNELIGLYLDSRKIVFRLSASVHPNGHGLAPVTSTPYSDALELLPGQVFSFPLYVTNTRSTPLELGTISRHDSAFTLVMIDPSAYPHSETSPSPFVVQPMTRSPLLATFLYSAQSDSNIAGHIQVTFVKGPMYKLFYNISVVGNKVPKVNLGVLRSPEQRLDSPVYFTNPSESVLSVRDAFVMLPNISLVPPRTVLFATAVRDADFDHGDSRTHATLARCITVTPVFGQVLPPHTRTLVATVSVLGEACLKAVTGVSPTMGLRRLIGPLGLRLNASAPPAVPDRTFEYRFAVDVVVGSIFRVDDLPPGSSPPVLFAPATRTPPPKSSFTHVAIALLPPGRVPLVFASTLPTGPKITVRQVTTSAPWLVVVPPEDGNNNPVTNVIDLGEATLDVSRLPQPMTQSREEALTAMLTGTITSTIHVPMPGGGIAQVTHDTTLAVAIRPFVLVEQAAAAPKTFDLIVDPMGENKHRVAPEQYSLPFSDAWALPSTREWSSEAHIDAQKKLKLQGSHVVNGVHLGIIEEPDATTRNTGKQLPPVSGNRRVLGEYACPGVQNKTVHFVNPHNFSVGVYAVTLNKDLLWSASANGHGLSVTLVHGATVQQLNLDSYTPATASGPLVNVLPGGSFTVNIKFMMAPASKTQPRAQYGRFSGILNIDAVAERTRLGARRILGHLPKHPQQVPHNAAHVWFGMEVPVTYGLTPRGGDIFFQEEYHDLLSFPWSRRAVAKGGVTIAVSRDIVVRSTLPFDVPITSAWSEMVPPGWSYGGNNGGPKSLFSKPPSTQAATPLHDAFQVHLTRYDIPANATTTLGRIDFIPSYVQVTKPEQRAGFGVAPTSWNNSPSISIDLDVPPGYITSSSVGSNPLLGVPRRVVDGTSATNMAPALSHPFGATFLAEAQAATLVPYTPTRSLFRLTQEVSHFVENLKHYDTTPDRIIMLTQFRAWSERVRSATHFEHAVLTIAVGGSRWSAMLVGEAGFSRAAVGYTQQDTTIPATAAIEGGANATVANATSLLVEMVQFPLHYPADINFGIYLTGKASRTPTTTGSARSASGARSSSASPTKRYLVVTNPGRLPLAVQPLMLAEASDETGAPLDEAGRCRMKDTAERYWDYLHNAVRTLRAPSPLAADDAWHSKRTDLFFLGPEARRATIVPPGGTVAIGPIYAAGDICQRSPPEIPGDDSPRSVYGILLLRNNDTFFEPIRLHATCGGSPVTIHTVPESITMHDLKRMAAGLLDPPPPAAGVDATVSAPTINRMDKDRRSAKTGGMPSLTQLWRHLVRPFRDMSSDGQSRLSWSHTLYAHLLPEHYAPNGNLNDYIVTPRLAARVLGPAQFEISVMLRNPAGVPIIINEVRLNGAKCVTRVADYSLRYDEAAEDLFERKQVAELHHGGPSSGGWLLPSVCVGVSDGHILDGSTMPNRPGLELPQYGVPISSVVLLPDQYVTFPIYVRPDFEQDRVVTGNITVYQQYRPQDAGATPETFAQTHPVRVTFEVPITPIADHADSVTAWDAIRHYSMLFGAVLLACAVFTVVAVRHAKASLRAKANATPVVTPVTTTPAPPSKVPPKTPAAKQPPQTTTNGAPAVNETGKAKPPAAPSSQPNTSVPKKGAEAPPPSTKANKKSATTKSNPTASGDGAAPVANGSGSVVDTGNPLTKQSSIASSEDTPVDNTSRASGLDTPLSNKGGATPNKTRSRPSTPPPSEARPVPVPPEPAVAVPLPPATKTPPITAINESDDEASTPPPKTSSTLPPDAKEQLAALAAAAAAKREAEQAASQPAQPAAKPPLVGSAVPDWYTPAAPSHNQHSKGALPSPLNAPIGPRPTRGSATPPLASPSSASSGSTRRVSPTSSKQQKAHQGGHERTDDSGTTSHRRSPPAAPRDPPTVSPTRQPRGPNAAGVLQPRENRAPQPSTTSTPPQAAAVLPGLVIAGTMRTGTTAPPAAPVQAPSTPPTSQRAAPASGTYLVTTTPSNGTTPGQVQSVVVTFPGAPSKQPVSVNPRSTSPGNKSQQQPNPQGTSKRQQPPPPVVTTTPSVVVGVESPAEDRVYLSGLLRPRGPQLQQPQQQPAVQVLGQHVAASPQRGYAEPVVGMPQPTAEDRPAISLVGPNTRLNTANTAASMPSVQLPMGVMAQPMQAYYAVPMHPHHHHHHLHHMHHLNPALTGLMQPGMMALNPGPPPPSDSLHLLLESFRPPAQPSGPQHLHQQQHQLPTTGMTAPPLVHRSLSDRMDDELSPLMRGTQPPPQPPAVNNNNPAPQPLLPANLAFQEFNFGAAGQPGFLEGILDNLE